MNIRRATIEDLKSVQELNSMLFKKEVEDFNQDFDETWGFSENGTKCISDWIQSENCLTLVAEENSKLVGYLVGEIRELPAWRKKSKAAELVEVFILDEHRSKGIGSQLIGKFLAWCKEKGVERIKIEASAGNQAAIRFYKRKSFKEKRNIFGDRALKKVWIIIAGLIIVVVAGTFLFWKYWPADYDTIQYGKGLYRSSLTPAMTHEELQQNNFGDVVSSGVFYHSREIFISGGVEFPYGGGHTVIFLKQKNADLFDVYSLQGGP